MSKHVIMGIGNPLLDMTVQVTQEFLDKYNLKANDAVVVHKDDMFDDMKKNFEVEYTAGGATQNSIRAAQWILDDESKKSTLYFGSVGKDESAEILREKVAEDGVDVRYQVDPHKPTGRCAVLVSGHNRSLVASHKASKSFTIDFLDSEDNWEVLTECKIFYCAAYFVNTCIEAMERIGKYASENEKYFGTNISATYLATEHNDLLLRVIRYSNFVFCNDRESRAFSKSNKFDTDDYKEIAQKISKLELAGHKFRIVVITRAEKPVVLVDEKGEVSEIPVPAVSNVVDTNGAGDALVGGFLSQLSKDKPIADCVRCGIWAAGEVIQRAGCTFPDKKYTE